MFGDLEEKLALIDEESLMGFRVEEHFCSECMKMTPHHIEDEENARKGEILNDEDFAVDALSVKHCVNCRDLEENNLDF